MFGRIQCFLINYSNHSNDIIELLELIFELQIRLLLPIVSIRSINTQWRIGDDDVVKLDE